MCLHTGMRPNEAAQLHSENIKLVEGIWVIEVNDTYGNQRVKNASAKCLIPIHHRLIKLGFVEYAQASRTGHIFPELTFSQKGGYSSYISEWFSKEYGSQFEGKGMYHFRHTFLIA
ncbi:hypothetical protein N9R79_05985 [Vibrio sp.]|nr:hypothetical protein [Vibrio sp.]